MKVLTHDQKSRLGMAFKLACEESIKGGNIPSMNKVKVKIATRKLFDIMNELEQEVAEHCGVGVSK